MRSPFALVLCIAVAMSFGVTTGCRQEPAPAPPPSEPAPPAELPAENEQPAAAMPPADEPTQPSEVEAAFAALSAEDRALAERQKICPVGGGPLGSMGTPIKVTVAGHTVFLCCEHCREPLLEDPATHLATIGLEPAEETTRSE